MEKKTVYVVVDSWQFNCGKNGQIVRVYETLEKAQCQAISLQETALEKFKEMFPDTYNVHNDTNVFEVWESDNYNFNHETVNIYVKEVN